MDSRSADWHLLFGLLALQNGLISRGQLVSAFAKWTSDKSVALDEWLVADGAIDPQRRDILKQMVEFHVQNHGGDAQKSLMTLRGSDLPAAREDLEQLNDSDLHKSMAAIPDRDVFATAPPTVGIPTSSGGRFRILRPLPGAHGGMGEISVAKDEELGRQVALKQILSDKADHTVYRQKFQVEAEITGNLEHPGIVPVYGLGAGPDGRPYYAMRLVHGDNLSAKIQQFHERREDQRANYNSVEFHGLVDRLIDVAQAICYAHSRGVLHRDLKPGNILVGEYGETLVIDWGLARLPQATGSESDGSIAQDRIDAKSPLLIRSGSNVDATMQGQALGTVGYAPPEQLNGRIDLITERSDVYALGAILYQILVGSAPIGSQDKSAKLGDLIKQTIEGRIKPPRQVGHSVPKSLSAICMKALQREPSERYESVTMFIQELERWKADQPVIAAPDSMADRLLRMARRYRTAALAAAAALLGIAFVTGLALVVVNRARVNEAAAHDQAEALAAETTQLAIEKTQLAEEKTELANRNQTVVDTFVAAFRSSDPKNEGVTSKMTALEVLRQALTRIETDEDLARDVLTKATLLDALGKSLLSLGACDQANSAFEESLRLRKTKLGPEHPDTLDSMNNLALGYDAAGRHAEAFPLYEQTLRLTKATLGPEHPDTLASMNNLALAYYLEGRLKEAVPLYEETFKLMTAQLGSDDPGTLSSMSNLAAAYKSAGRLEEALTLYEETLRLRTAKLGPDHPDTLNSMGNLATGYEAAGRFADALPLLEKTLRLETAKLGPEHPTTLDSMGNLAMAYHSAGRLQEALTLMEKTLRSQTATLGPDHPDTLNSMGNLAVAYESVGRLQDALPLYEETVRRQTAKLGREHPNTLNSMRNLAMGYKSDGRLEEALPLYEETLRLRTATLGPDHPDTLESMGNLAVGYQAAGRLAEALTLDEETLRLKTAKLGPEHPDTLASMNNLAMGYEAAGRLKEALTLFEKTLRLQTAKLGPEHPDTLISMNNLAGGYKAAGRLKEALTLFEKTLRLQTAKLGPEHPATLTSMNNLASAYVAVGRLQDALPLYEETVRLQTAKLGREHPNTLTSMSNLAMAYKEFGRLADALPLCQETLRLRTAKLGLEHPDTLISMTNLAATYEVAGRLEEAVPLYEETLRLCTAKLGPKDPRTVSTMVGLAATLLQSKAFEKANEVITEWVSIIERSPTPNRGQLARAKTSLAESFVGLARYAEATPQVVSALSMAEIEDLEKLRANSIQGAIFAAQENWQKTEPLLIDTAEALTAKIAEMKILNRWYAPRACERVIAMYEAWGKPEEAAKWKAKLAEVNAQIDELRNKNVSQADEPTRGEPAQ